MSRALDIDVARALPAIARLMQPTPQGPGADGEALGGQVVRQQRHRPACGLVAAAARIAGQGGGQPPRREGVVKARTPAARPVDQGRGLMLSLVLHQPSVDAGAIDPAAAGRLGDGMPLGRQQALRQAACDPPRRAPSRESDHVVACSPGNTRSPRVASLMATYLERTYSSACTGLPASSCVERMNILLRLFFEILDER